jgi:tRNA-specific 2-thiouridylase
VIYTGEGKSHKGLYRKALFVKDKDIHWVRPDLELGIGEELEVVARIRYRQPLEKAVLYRSAEGLYVSFSNPQSAVSEGQFVAWYEHDELLGSGVIS